MLKFGVFAALVVLTTAVPAVVPNSRLALTPPMGWMSWEVFRCDIDCKADPTMCVSEDLYKQMADHLAADGFLEAGYKTVSIDDCWEQKDPKRTATGELTPNSTRFPSGFKALGDYMHSKGVSFGIYSDEGTSTCGGYPGSKGYEKVDAATFAAWGVDYLKLDGCNNDQQGCSPSLPTNSVSASYVTGYPAMGHALQSSGRDIVYSCSWPAYLGDNETAKPWDEMIAAGCNLWRNWRDIQGNWGSLVSIIDHFGNYSATLQRAAGPTGPYGGHWNDMDMLLIGQHEAGGLPGVTLEEGKTQFAVWSMLAAPLIMGNDLRNMSAEAKAVLLNKEVIAVDQDPKGIQGMRVSPFGDQEVWARELDAGAMAVLLLNKGDMTAKITATLEEIGWTGAEPNGRDLFNHRDLGKVTFDVVSHGAVLIRLSP